MRLLWEEKAWEDYCFWQKQDKKTLKKNQRFNKRYSAELLFRYRETRIAER